MRAWFTCSEEEIMSTDNQHFPFTQNFVEPLRTNPQGGKVYPKEHCAIRFMYRVINSMKLKMVIRRSEQRIALSEVMGADMLLA
jgi:hypothetical protein